MEERMEYEQLPVIALRGLIAFPHTSILAWRIPWTEEPGGL